MDEIILYLSLAIIAFLYASVGHGGASGYLAILSLTIYGLYDPSWLKQHVWCLNICVASIAFFHYYRAGFHEWRLTAPFVLASIPTAFLGGLLKINSTLYDTLLSLTLIYAAWRLSSVQTHDVNEIETNVPNLWFSLFVGSLIGFFSGMIGVGGGIFLSPILLINRWSSPKSAAATASLFICLNSISGLTGAAFSGQLILELDILLPLLISVILGGFFGSYYGAWKAHQNRIRSVLVMVLVIAASRRILNLVILFI